MRGKFMPDSTPGVDGDFASGFAGWCIILGVLFIILKLVGAVSWPWLWVLAPFWLPFVSLILLVIIVAIFVSLLGGK